MYSSEYRSRPKTVEINGNIELEKNENDYAEFI